VFIQFILIIISNTVVVENVMLNSFQTLSRIYFGNLTRKLPTPNLDLRINFGAGSETSPPKRYGRVQGDDST